MRLTLEIQLMMMDLFSNDQVTRSLAVNKLEAMINEMKEMNGNDLIKQKLLNLYLTYMNILSSTNDVIKYIGK